MMSITRAGGLLGIVLLVLGPTVGIEIAKGATGAPDPSDGWQIPEGAATEPNPEPLTAANLTRGQSLYKAKCQRCHGVDGVGHGPESDPDHPAADLTDGRRASRNPDGVMFYKIWNGRAKPKMPAMKSDVSRADVWKLVHYVKTLRRQQPAGD
jgi:mono/diheme cytochrome c family protein